MVGVVVAGSRLEDQRRTVTRIVVEDSDIAEQLDSGEELGKSEDLGRQVELEEVAVAAVHKLVVVDLREEERETVPESTDAYASLEKWS